MCQMYSFLSLQIKKNPRNFQKSQICLGSLWGLQIFLAVPSKICGQGGLFKAKRSK